MSIAELEQFLSGQFPQTFHRDSGLAIENVAHGHCRIRQTHRDAFLRPGGTISGPTMMALADVAMYVAVLAAVGPVPLAVTTSFNINFLRKTVPGDLVAECRLIKLGRRLAVGEIEIRAADDDAIVAHATSTYSIPPSVI
jgi:uncharacterized protein (TIGR00369 family)